MRLTDLLSLLVMLVIIGSLLIAARQGPLRPIVRLVVAESIYAEPVPAPPATYAPSAHAAADRAAELDALPQSETVEGWTSAGARLPVSWRSRLLDSLPTP